MCGPYRVLAPIASGGMGTVYRAEHAQSGDIVALKTVSVADNRMLASIRREIHALAHVRHPGIVRVVDEGMADGVPWYAMPLLQGETLRDFSRRMWGVMHGADATLPGHLADGDQLAPAPADGPATPPRVDPDALRRMLTLLRRLCDALGFLHGEGIVHRDLKPENVFVLARELPVLMDFGLSVRTDAARSRERVEIVGGVVGTVAYMAPELISGANADARGDLYALGCLIYECVTGRVPFAGNDVRSVMRGHLYEPPRPPSSIVRGVPDRLERLILRLLEKNPRDRWGHAKDIARELIALGAEAPAESEAPAARDYLYRPEFVGRQSLLSSLEIELDAIADGVGRLVAIGGESGSGKTRLAMELAHRALRKQARVVAGECAPRSAPLRPLAPLLQAVADQCHEGGPEETERLLGDCARVLVSYAPALADVPGMEEMPPAGRLTGRAARGRLLGALWSTLYGFSQDRPVVVVLDDLQWADELTLAFLERLGRGGLEGVNALVIGTYRSEEADAPLRSLLLSGADGHLRLNRFDRETTGEMIAGMLGTAEAPRALVDFVWQQAEGNAFFIAEYLRTAVDEGLLRRDEEGRWRTRLGDAEVSELRALPLPGSIRALVERRLAGLSAPARSVVELAAVLGSDVDLALLSQLAALDEAVDMDAVHELIARHFLRETTPQRAAFVHDKLREVTYDAVAPARRRALHAAAGLALEARFEGDRRAHLMYAPLARHFARAGIRDKALTYLEKAAEQSISSGRYREALAFLDEAAELDRTGGGEGVTRLSRARWQRMMGEAYFGLGRLDVAGEHSTRALALLGHKAPGSSLAAASSLATGLGRQAVHLLAPRAIGARGAASRAALAEAALAASKLAERYYFSFDPARMLASSLMAVNLAERAGREAQVARMYALLGLALGQSRLPRLADSFFRRARDGARASDDRAGLVFARYAEAAYLLGVGRWAQVDEAARDALAVAHQLGDPHEINVVETILGHAEFYRGDLDASAQRYARITESARAAANLQHEAWGLYAQARALLELDGVEESIPLLTAARDVLEGQGDVASEIICYGLLGSALLRHGRDGEARAAADEAARRIGQTLPVVFSAWSGYASAADVYLSLWERGDASAAAGARRVSRALRLFAFSFPIARPAAERIAGRCALARGDRRRALRWWSQSAETAERLEMAHEAALARRRLEGS